MNFKEKEKLIRKIEKQKFKDKYLKTKNAKEE